MERLPANRCPQEYTRNRGIVIYHSWNLLVCSLWLAETLTRDGCAKSLRGYPPGEAAGPVVPQPQSLKCCKRRAAPNHPVTYAIN